MRRLSQFFWPVVRILPLDFTPELTDYEFLLRVYYKLKETIEAVNKNADAIEGLQNDMEIVKEELEKIKNGDYSFLREIIEKAIKNVWFGLTDEGRFVAYIPESWDKITFNITGYDIFLSCHPEYGRLVLSY